VQPPSRTTGERHRVKPSRTVCFHKRSIALRQLASEEGIIILRDKGGFDLSARFGLGLNDDRRGHGGSDGAFEGMEKRFAAGEGVGFGVHGI